MIVFTFNLISTNSVSQQLFEMVFLFILLTVFLHRSENLLINPIIFVQFNLYKGHATGTNYTILLPKFRTGDSIETQNKEHFIQITNRIVLFHYNDSDYSSTNRFINRTIFMLVSILICCILFVFNIFSWGGGLEILDVILKVN